MNGVWRSRLKPHTQTESQKRSTIAKAIFSKRLIQYDVHFLNQTEATGKLMSNGCSTLVQSKSCLTLIKTCESHSQKQHMENIILTQMLLLFCDIRSQN